MEPQRVRRRRRRRSSQVRRESLAWLTLVVSLVKKVYHWLVLGLIVAFILMVGFAVPMFA